MSDTSAPAASATPTATEGAAAPPAATDPSKPGEGAAPAEGEGQKPAANDNGYEARMERALIAQRQAETARKEADVKLKQAQDLEKKLQKYSGIDEKLTKGQFVELAQELFGEKFSEALLMDMAVALAAKAEPKDPRDLVREELDRRDAEAKRKKDEDDAAAAAAKDAEDQKIYEDFVDKAKAALDAGAEERFNLCHTLGVDMERFDEVLDELIEKKGGTCPDVEEILDVLEGEHEARLAKQKKFVRGAGGAAPAAAKDPASGVTIVPRGPASDEQFDDPVEAARARNKKSLELELAQAALANAR